MDIEIGHTELPNSFVVFVCMSSCYSRYLICFVCSFHFFFFLFEILFFCCNMEILSPLFFSFLVHLYTAFWTWYLYFWSSISSSFILTGRVVSDCCCWFIRFFFYSFMFRAGHENVRIKARKFIFSSQIDRVKTWMNE